MPNDAVLPKLAGIIARFAGVDPAGITRDSRLTELGIDSLAMIEIVVAAEDAFGVRIPDEEAERFATAGDLADFLQTAHMGVGRG